MKPILLDLFCGAGGCTKGYQNAGFYVVGVDIEPQPNYCGDEFVQGDAIEVLEKLTTKWSSTVSGWSLEDFAAIHASPPCQSYSLSMKHLAKPKPKMVSEVRRLLRSSGLPWIIENVLGAPLVVWETNDGRFGVELCGSMFGLRVKRHRLFETNFPVGTPKNCDHTSLAMNPHNQSGRDRIYEEFGRRNPDPIWNEAMGVGWMGRNEGREAIPPAYTEHVGRQLRCFFDGESEEVAC